MEESGRPTPEYFKDLFKGCGEIVDIRFPSLVANVRRRFCYVQFLDPVMALKGAAMNGMDLGDPYKLVAKISDPVQKGARGGATEEGRECYVQNVYWHANEKDVKHLFQSYGDVESVRLPKNIAGKNKGTAFVVFSEKVCLRTSSVFISLIVFSDLLLTSSYYRPQLSERSGSSIKPNSVDAR